MVTDSVFSQTGPKIVGPIQARMPSSTRYSHKTIGISLGDLTGATLS